MCLCADQPSWTYKHSVLIAAYSLQWHGAKRLGHFSKTRTAVQCFSFLLLPWDSQWESPHSRKEVMFQGQGCTLLLRNLRRFVLNEACGEDAVIV